MLVQLMFSIGLDGDIVPNTQAELERLGVNEPLIQNVSDVIQSACASCFEIHMALDAKRMKYTECDMILDLVSVAKYHNLRLAVLMKTCFDLRALKGKRLPPGSGLYTHHNALVV
jgi:hypothetical protein